MKKTETFVVIRSKENGHYLSEYKNNGGAFAYSAGWVDTLQNAAANTVESVERQNEKIQKLAEAFGGELIEVTATYELKTLDGNEPEDLTKSIEEAKKETFKNLLEMFVKNSEED